MKKEDLIALGLDEATATKVAAASEAELALYVPKKEHESAQTAAQAAKAARDKVLAALGIKEDNVDAELAGLTASLEALKKSGTKPDEVGAKLAALTGQITQLTEKYNQSEQRAAAERTKRIEAAKLNKAVAALTKGNAANPSEIAKIVLASIQAKDDDSIVYCDGDKELSIEDGVKAYLAANPWAVSNTQKPGAGSYASGTGPAKNPFSKDSWNMTEQGRMYKENPEMAKSLAVEAGIEI